MAFNVRSLDAISQSVRGAMRQYLPGTDASLKQNALYVIGKVQTILSREYELRLAWIFKQLFLTTATEERIIRMQAAEVDVLQKPASAASGFVAGVGAPNATYPGGIRFLSGGNTYVTDAFTTDAVGSFTAPVRAEQVGAATNRDADAVLLLADPSLWPTLPPQIGVAGGIGGGADAEDMEALRQRGLLRKRTPPQGGALPDYERWAREVPGVAAAWAANFANGVGHIGVWPLFSGRPNAIPTIADLATVEAYIVGKRIVRGAFYAVAPIEKPVDLTIALSPDTVMQRAAVTGALQTFFDATRPDSRIQPGLPGQPFTLSRSWLAEAISTTAGEASHVLVEPATDIVFQPGELPVLGTIDWA